MSALLSARILESLRWLYRFVGTSPPPTHLLKIERSVQEKFISRVISSGSDLCLLKSVLLLLWFMRVIETLTSSTKPKLKAIKPLESEEESHRKKIHPKPQVHLSKLFLTISAVFLTHITGKQRKVRVNFSKMLT